VAVTAAGKADVAGLNINGVVIDGHRSLTFEKDVELFVSGMTVHADTRTRRQKIVMDECEAGGGSLILPKILDTLKIADSPMT
jgi:hypothetical protein